MWWISLLTTQDPVAALVAGVFFWGSWGDTYHHKKYSRYLNLTSWLRAVQQFKIKLVVFSRIRKEVNKFSLQTAMEVSLSLFPKPYRCVFFLIMVMLYPWHSRLTTLEKSLASPSSRRSFSLAALSYLVIQRSKGSRQRHQNQKVFGGRSQKFCF